MKKILIFCGFLGCGAFDILEPIKDPVVEPVNDPVVEVPTTEDPVVEVPTTEDPVVETNEDLDALDILISRIGDPKYYNNPEQDVINSFAWTLVHEFGHAFGMLHPFASPSYGTECYNRLLDNGYSLSADTNWREFLSKHHSDYDAEGLFAYDPYSVMNYSLCREGYAFDPNPTQTDLAFVRVLNSVFVDSFDSSDSLNLTVPVTIDTVDFFRRRQVVDVCVVNKQNNTDIQNKLITELVKFASDAWSPTNFNIQLNDTCYMHKEEVRIEVNTLDLYLDEDELIVLGWSTLLTFGGNREKNMGIALPENVDELIELMVVDKYIEGFRYD